MQVITVIKLKNNTVEELHAYNGDGHEEVAKAEAKFIELGKSIYRNPYQPPSGKQHLTDEEWEMVVQDGHIEVGEDAVNLVWASNQITTLAVYGDAKRSKR